MAPEEIIIQSGLYTATEDGFIISHWHGGNRKLSAKNQTGDYVSINANVSYKKVFTVKAHRLVWWYFNGPIPKGMVINHKNFNRQDNSLENLEVVTPAENTRHAAKAGRLTHTNHNPVKGEAHPRAKLTNKRVRDIEWRVNYLCETIHSISRDTGVGIVCVFRIKHHQSWKHLWEN